MPVMPVWLIDTSVFVEILNVPGKSQQHEVVAAEFVSRHEKGHRFVLPVTTIIETGNHIAHCPPNRRNAAERFVLALEQAQSDSPPWIVRDVKWDRVLLSRLLEGNSTGSDLLNLLGDGRMGTGDVALLVERDEFRNASSFTDVRVWTLEAALGSYA